METILLIVKFLLLILAVGFGVYYICILAGAGFAEGVLKSLRRNNNGKGKK